MGVGQYCSNYITQYSFATTANTIPPCSAASVTGQCGWGLYSGCTLLSSVTNSEGTGDYTYSCASGCYTASPCTGVANGVLTSAGTNGDPNSCQIQCNPGYKLQNRACIYVGNCNLCPVGTYSATGSTACTTCPSGTFAQTLGSTTCGACIACTDGYYAANCGTGVGVCTQCPVGYYSRAGATVCTACPLGQYSTVPGATSSSTCIQCATGTYANTPGSTCTQCPQWYTTASTGTPDISGCNTCVPGTSSSTGVCAKCTEGTYAAGLGSSQCANCTSGWYSDAGETVCHACSAGTYFVSNVLSGPTTITNAPAVDYTQIMGPVPVGAGQYCSVYYGGYSFYYSADNPTVVCNIFDPQFPPRYCIWPLGNGCDDLGVEPYQNSFYIHFRCNPGCMKALPCTNGVNNGMYTGPGVNGDPMSCPFSCNPGYIMSNGQCVYAGHCANCQAGKYASTPGSLSCSDCPAQTYTPTTAATTCTSCQVCNAGYYYSTICAGLNAGVCSMCTNT